MKNIFKIIRISKPLHRLVAILGILILATSLLNLVAPVLSKFIVDEIVAKIQLNKGSTERLIFLIVVAFGANFLGLAINTVSDRLGDHFAGRLRRYPATTPSVD